MQGWLCSAPVELGGGEWEKNLSCDAFLIPDPGCRTTRPRRPANKRHIRRTRQAVFARRLLSRTERVCCLSSGCATAAQQSSRVGADGSRASSWGSVHLGGARGDWTAGRMSPFGRGGNPNGFGEAAAAASQLHFEVDSKGRVKDSPRWSGKGAHGKHLERGNAMHRYDLSLLSVGFYRLHLSSILTF